MANQIVLNLLQQHRYTGGMLANLFGVGRSTVYESIDGMGSRVVRVAIARILNQLPSTLWPENSVDVKVLDNFYYVVSHQLGLSVPDLPRLLEKVKEMRL